MPDAPVFRRYFDSVLYWFDAGSAAGPGWIGFVWTSANPPPELTLSASFVSGHYLFAPSAPSIADTAAGNAYANAVITWLQTSFGSPFLSYACIWLPNAVGPVFPTQPNAGALTFGFSGATPSVTNNFNLPAGQLTFSVPQLTLMGMGARGLEFSRIGTGKVQFNLLDSPNPPSVTGNSGLPFLGNYAGAFTVAGGLSRSGSLSAINAMATGFHYCYQSPSGTVRQIYPVLVAAPSLPDLQYSGSVDPLGLFNTTPLSAPAQGRLRTQFGVTGPNRLGSWYRTPSGRAIDLIPLSGLDGNGEPLPWCSALVLQSRQAATAPVQRVYLTPAGDYALAEKGGAKDGQTLSLLPGLFGSERIELTAWRATGSFDRLRFVAGQAANAPVFPYPPANLNDPNLGKPKPRLDATHVTAWAAVLNGTGGNAVYLAQPQGNPLYAPPKNASSDDLALLPPLATPSPIPQTGPVSGLMLLPFAPYAGIDGSAAMANLGEFESQILSAARKERLGAASTARVTAVKRARRSRLAALATAETHQATTSQGLYAEVELPSAASAETLYHKVVLARSIAKLPDTGSLDFGFESLTPELQNLFETNQLMAVIVNPAKLGAPSPGAVRAAADGPVFDRNVVIADWLMKAAVGSALNATAYTNILILKYCDGSLLERVANPNKWVGTDTFSLTASGGADPSVALTGLSNYLQDYLQAGIDAAKTNTLYADFAKIVNDPKWQGFIVLAADVDPSGFPDQIKGLTAGIDFTQFRAHHFGATATRVTVSGSTVTMEVPSSLFGLIDYQLPAFRNNVAAGGSPDMPLPLPADGDFGFQVLQLQALFRNAALIDFRSHVQLTVNQLFLSPVTSAYGTIGKLPAQGVVLNGSYQRQGTTGVYVFQQNATTRFQLQSNVLPLVAIQRVVFNTLSSGDEPGGDGLVRSRFLMSGALEFALLTVTLPDNGGVRDADLLSFGQPPGALPTGPAQGLSFSGLEVSMTSPIDAPNAVTFVFEIAKLALDAGASQPRAHSVFTDLALQVDSFIAGAEDKRPVDFGFLPVSVEPKIKALSGPWFGIAYKVTMGSPGGLVAQAGFTSRLLLAWAPTSLSGETTAAVFTGLQLPGAAPGAKLFSIQGVLKLSIDSILLRREKVSGADLSFTLRLNNVGLTFLGIVKLPPGAAINFFLFGDPSGTGSLGWYAAYIKDNKTALAKLDGPPQLPPPPGASPSRLPEHTS